MDSATYIGQEVKAIMSMIASIDMFSPDEDMVEVLIASMSVWGAIEAELLFTALEAAFEDAEAATLPARDRLNILYSLQLAIHDGEGAEEPFNDLAQKYIDGVKYHLAADVQEILPLVVQLPVSVSRDLAQSMQAMKLDLG